MMIRRAVTGWIVAAALASPVAAAGIEQLTLRDAIMTGVERNHLIKAARHVSDAAQAGATAAQLHFMPSLTLEESWARTNIPVNTFMMKLNQGQFTSADMQALAQPGSKPATLTDYTTSATLEQPLFVPTAWAGARVVRLGAERQQALAGQTVEQIALRIYQGYLNVYKSHAYLQLAEKAVEEARESRRQAHVRLTAGLGLKSDELRADTQLAAMEQQAITARNNLTLARMQLAIAIGGSRGQEVDVKGPIRLKAQQSAMTLDQLLQQARTQRQDLVAAERGSEQASASVLQARAQYLPTVAAVGAWQMHDNRTAFSQDQDGWSVGVALRWNIFDGFRTSYGNAQSVANRAAAEANLQSVRNDVEYQVREAWLRKDEAEKRHYVAQTALTAAEEATRLLAKRFENSLATMVELLDAQTALNQARANVADSEAHAAYAAGNVYYAAGAFLKEVQ